MASSMTFWTSSRIESGRMEMDFRNVSPHTLVLEALEPFQDGFQRPRCRSHDGGCQPICPKCRATPRMNHVFANLLSNALRYTPPGGKVTVLAGADEDWVRFSVSDTGKGIPSQYLPRIFEQFFTSSGAGQGVRGRPWTGNRQGDCRGSWRSNQRRKPRRKGSSFTFALPRAEKDRKEGTPL